MDLPLKGRNFTRFGGGLSKSMSRLDRFLVNSTWVSSFPTIIQYAIPGSLSDHVLICLEFDEINWGPKPFRFFDFWLGEKDFNKLVTDKWSSYSSNGVDGVGLFAKLKLLKSDIKSWNGYLKNGVTADLNGLEEEISKLEIALENDISNEEVAKKIVEKKSELWKLRKIDERIWRQKSRLKWTKEGDRDTKFFHAMARTKWNKNLIMQITVGDKVLSSPRELKSAVELHFKNHFQQGFKPTFSASSLPFRKLSQKQVEDLEAPFSEQEIWAVVKDYDGNKAPRPDGYNFNFFKAHWETLKSDIMQFMEDFYRTGKLAKGISSSFITLIVKKQCTETLSDFRPISLVSSVYKILSKTLANRLKKVMECIIGGSQSAFIKGRQILDSVLIANEVIDQLKKSVKGGLALKLDFEKAFDNVNWSFLLSVMEAMSFGQRWCSWIKECLSIARFSVLVKVIFSN